VGWQVTRSGAPLLLLLLDDALVDTPHAEPHVSS